ncbi:AAA family ATPase [Candidatus Woesearchaeota archaeon]|nr:AAA family ATPase [Candidatus Woesearchaeota archaeon]
MGLFDTVLKDTESLFLDTLPLDIDFIPPILEGRENEQQYIATCIQPLFQKRNGKNLFITGAPGIGKTVATRYVLNELHKKTDDIHTLYINCWKKDTPHKVALEICDQIDFKFVQQRDTNELFKEIARILNKKSAVIVLDEADKITDEQLFYHLLEEINRKTIILITNNDQWLSTLDARIRSRLMSETLIFKPYTFEETKNILKKRVEFAFPPGVLDQRAFAIIVERAFEAKDIRAGLYLLKEAGEIAEQSAQRKISMNHAAKAIAKLKEFKLKSTTTLDEHEQQILDIIKQNNGLTTKDLYAVYQKKGGEQSYSNFHKKIKSLESGRFITLEEQNEGATRATLVKYGMKTLQDFT